MAGADDMIRFTRSGNFSSRLGAELLSLREDDQFTDFTIICGEERLACHKVLLAANSPMLKAMIKANMKETKTKEIHLDSIPAPVMKILLQYMCTGEFQVPEKDLMDLIEAVNFLQLLELKQYCQEKVVAIVKPENAIAWFKFASKMNLNDVSTKCSEVMTSEFSEVCKSTEFLALSLTNFSSYLGDIKDKKMIDPDDILSATLLWGSHDPATRGPEMEKLVEMSPLQKCSVQCLTEESEKHADMLDQNPKVFKVLFDNLAAMISTTEFRRQRGGYLSKLPVILGGGLQRADLNDQFWCLDLPDSISDYCKIPADLCHLRSSFCKTRDGFIVTGGEGSDDCAQYTTTTNTWTRLKNLTSQRYCHASICLDGVLMVFGGRVDDASSDNVELFDMEDEIWEEGPSLPECVEDPILTSCNGAILFLLDTSSAQSLFQLKPHRISWQERASPPAGHYFGSQMICLDDDQLVVAGGAAVHARYTPSPDTWICCVATPNLLHMFAALLHVDNRLLLLGGHEQDRVEEYNMEARAWTVCDWKLPKRVGRLTGLVLDNQ